MKGIVLAGGTGSRLHPLTKVINKHLLPVGKYPMIYHPIYKLCQAGIRDILIVTGREHMGDVVNVLGSGHEFHTTFTYKVQDQPGGIAQALGLAEDYVGNDLMTVILGDNVFEDDLSMFVQHFIHQKRGGRILIREVSDPHRFGIAQIQDEKIISIEEKPKHPKSSYAVTGIYMYDPTVFEIVRTLKPSNRGELEITDVNNAYIAKGQLTFDILKGWWTDAGTHESLLRANQLSKNIDLSVTFDI